MPTATTRIHSPTAIVVSPNAKRETISQKIKILKNRPKDIRFHLYMVAAADLNLPTLSRSSLRRVGSTDFNE